MFLVKLVFGIAVAVAFLLFVGWTYLRKLLGTEKTKKPEPEQK